ncbi:hypothetical protein [Kitasatospora sp. NE20-6]|uniref:hypothetical protein n=1 Tax=Kitasatospora sp. NE20-6 TaxID=2859066 RepID=UPI0038B3F692
MWWTVGWVLVSAAAWSLWAVLKRVPPAAGEPGRPPVGVLALMCGGPPLVLRIAVEALTLDGYVHRGEKGRLHHTGAQGRPWDRDFAAFAETFRTPVMPLAVKDREEARTMVTDLRRRAQDSGLVHGRLRAVGLPAGLLVGALAGGIVVARLSGLPVVLCAFMATFIAAEWEPPTRLTPAGERLIGELREIHPDPGREAMKAAGSRERALLTAIHHHDDGRLGRLQQGWFPRRGLPGTHTGPPRPRKP